ncbi:MAG: celE [Rhodobacteraceae bacterium]|uniref:amidohydrolase n=1 Tax=Cypionkella sp. TaxID=2811411 RepID=UPI001320BA7A|nr:amidohydrolase [Cypionkella sp.]KAF0172667.1 MAG: celE [Paracoccaceae bacterium]MDO8325998.1 amidohydrolase [Cypionkella sp.]
MLTNADVAELTEFRRDLHRFPEVSREEAATAQRIVAALSGLRPDQVITGLGGHGVAAVFNGAATGPTLLFRAELDALPIEEISAAAHRSTIPGKGHLCGHDGHMTFLMGLARLLSRQRPARGRVVLMFQPAEEDGFGAAAVVADPNYAAIKPDWAFAIHNLPGLPFGHAALKSGVVNCASQGLRIVLTGKTAHASQPENGSSPGLALAQLIPALAALGQGGPLGPDYRLVTITHAKLGEPAFGIAPGEAELWATLRAIADDKMAALRAAAIALAETEAAGQGLKVSFSHHDDFAASVNNPDATRQLQRALESLAVPHGESDLPMRASEDFGRFGQPGTRSAMLFLGVGESHAALHNPDYDFPDSLIPLGVQIFHRVMIDLLA